MTELIKQHARRISSAETNRAAEECFRTDAFVGEEREGKGCEGLSPLSVSVDHGG